MSISNEDTEESAKLPSWHAAAKKLTEELTDDEIAAEKKAMENKETGCAIISLSIGAFIALIILIIVFAFSFTLMRHDPKVPFIVIGRYESR